LRAFCKAEGVAISFSNPVGLENVLAKPISILFMLFFYKEFAGVSFRLYKIFPNPPTLEHFLFALRALV